jgi:hypothetical protein
MMELKFPAEYVNHGVYKQQQQHFSLSSSQLYIYFTLQLTTRMDINPSIFYTYTTTNTEQYITHYKKIVALYMTVDGGLDYTSVWGARKHDSSKGFSPLT